MPEGLLRCTVIMVESVEGHRNLVVQLAVDCPACGKYELLPIAGHHLRALRDAVIDAIDQYPDLCGPRPNDVTRKLSFTTKPPTDPNVN